MALDLEPIVTLPWLVRLRWAFFAGQLVMLPVAHVWFGVAIDSLVIGIELFAMAASNLALSAVRAQPRWSRAHVIGGVMVLDSVLLTLLLAGAGGSANPFTVLYLVNITLSAIVLNAWWTSAIAVLSLAGFALLFTTSSNHAMMHHGGEGFTQHLQAMWGAFGLAAVLIAFFVGRVTREIASQREQIATLRAANERTERLASVTRLAAGAAHELGSPLATIAVAAHEAQCHLATTPDTVVADLELIVLEVERCQEILGHLAMRGSSEHADAMSLVELAEAIRDHLGEDASLRVDVAITADTRLVTPRDQLVQSIVALVDNALEATEQRVSVELAGGDQVQVAVVDHGDGIADDVLARIGSPFFTTKAAGRGLGLGVFLARAFCESRGGTLTIASEPGRGTRAVIRIPTEREV